MIQIRNNAALTTPIAFTTDAIVPFDTVDISTNGNLSLDNNRIAVNNPGVYDALCQVAVKNTSSSAAAQATLTAWADGKAIPGATVTATVASGADDSLILHSAVRVVSASAGTAHIHWQLSGAVSLTNARAQVYMYR